MEKNFHRIWWLRHCAQDLHALVEAHLTILDFIELRLKAEMGSSTFIPPPRENASSTGSAFAGRVKGIHSGAAA